ncbi:RNA replication protein [Bienertia sinuspersici]
MIFLLMDSMRMQPLKSENYMLSAGMSIILCLAVLQDQEKVRRKKVPAVNGGENVRVESTSAVQSQYVDVKVVSDPGVVGATQHNRFSTQTSSAPAPGISTATANATAISMPGIASSVSLPCTDVFTLERLKQEKAKAAQKNSLIGGKGVDMGVKKKVKKKTENLMGELPLHPEKSCHQGDDKKQHKHPSGLLQNVPVSQATMNTDMSR